MEGNLKFSLRKIGDNWTIRIHITWGLRFSVNNLVKSQAIVKNRGLKLIANDDMDSNSFRIIADIRGKHQTLYSGRLKTHTVHLNAKEGWNPVMVSRLADSLSIIDRYIQEEI